MKKFIISLILATGVLVGCTSTPQQDTSHQDTSHQGTPREYAKPVMEGELTIATMYDDYFLEEAAVLFMEKYPDVTVTINTGINLEDFMIVGDGYTILGGEEFDAAIENYHTQLNMRLMNGSAEDIFFTSGLPLISYINMGVFEDLSFYLDNSPEINNENHFMDIIHAFEDDDSKIWQIPISFDIDRMIYFNSVLVEESGLSIGQDVKSITLQEAVNFSISLLENTHREDAFLYWHFDSIAFDLIWGDIEEFINIKDKEVNLDSDEFISLLESIQELGYEGYYPNFDEEFINWDVFDNYYYALDYTWGAINTAVQSLTGDGNMYSILPLADSKGNVHLRSHNTVAINSASENKDLAWEFIKFLLSDELDIYFFDIPVNKNKYHTTLESAVESNNNFSETEIDYDEANEMIQGWISQLNNRSIFDDSISMIVYEELDKFLEGEQSAEETATILQSSVHRYIHETY